MNLKEILAKKPADLSAAEKAFLQANWKQLSTDEQAEFSEVAPADGDNEVEDEKAFAALMQKTVQERIEAQADEFAKTFLNDIAKQRAKAIDTGRPAQDEHREVTKQWLTAIISRDYAALKAMSTGVDSAAGYTVPTVISNEIIRKANTEYGRRFSFCFSAKEK